MIAMLAGVARRATGGTRGRSCAHLGDALVLAELGARELVEALDDLSVPLLDLLLAHRRLLVLERLEPVRRQVVVELRRELALLEHELLLLLGLRQPLLQVLEDRERREVEDLRLVLDGEPPVLEVGHRLAELEVLLLLRARLRQQARQLAHHELERRVRHRVDDAEALARRLVRGEWGERCGVVGWSAPRGRVRGHAPAPT